MIVVAAPPQPKPSTQPLSSQLTVSLTGVEKDAVSTTAKASGLSMSAWARQAINSALSRSGTHGT